MRLPGVDRPCAWLRIQRPDPPDAEFEPAAGGHARYHGRRHGGGADAGAAATWPAPPPPESAGGVAGARLLRERLLAKSGGRVGVTLGADADPGGLGRGGGDKRTGCAAAGRCRRRRCQARRCPHARPRCGNAIRLESVRRGISCPPALCRRMIRCHALARGMAQIAAALAAGHATCRPASGWPARSPPRVGIGKPVVGAATGWRRSGGPADGQTAALAAACALRTSRCARSLAAELTRPRRGGATCAWRYRGGPWEAAERIRFTAAAYPRESIV